MQKAELPGCFSRKLTPIAQGLLQQREGSGDVGRDEVLRAVDRTVDMAFGRKVHDGVGPKLFENLSHGGGVRNVGLQEMIARIGPGAWNRSRIGGIGQLIDIEDFMIGFRQQQTKKSRADETVAAGDRNYFLRRHDQATCVSGAMFLGKSSGDICGKPIKYCP